MVVDAIADDHLMSLLEWSPLVMVAHGTLGKVASWGIRVDVVLNDAHAHSDLVTEIPYVGPALELDASRGLPEVVYAYLRSLGQSAVNVLVSSPEKYFGVWDMPDVQVNLIDFEMKWSRIASGNFEKWLPAGAVVLVSTQEAFDTWGGSRNGHRVTASGDSFVRISSASPFWIGERHRDEIYPP